MRSNINDFKKIYAYQKYVLSHRQHITGMEQKYIQEVFSKGLDSASHFTLMCSARLQEIVGPASQRVVMVPSGEALFTYDICNSIY